MTVETNTRTAASKLMVAACLIFITLMHSMLRYETRSRRLSQASAAAERRLALVQSQLRALGPNWNQASNWTPLLAARPEVDAPGVSTQVRIAERNLLTPCSSLEKGFVVGRQRAFGHSLLQVEVVALWGPAAEQRVVLQGAYAGPPPVIDHIEVRQVGGASSPLAAHAGMQLEARAVDPGGAQVGDVAFAWHIKAVTGTARLLPDPNTRLGQRCELRNEVQRPDGTLRTFGPDPLTGGLRKCRAQVRVHWLGQDRWGESDEILLQP